MGKKRKVSPTPPPDLFPESPTTPPDLFPELRAQTAERSKHEAHEEEMYLQAKERAHLVGDPLALWEVVWRCELDNGPKPEWARQAHRLNDRRSRRIAVRGGIDRHGTLLG